MTAVELASVAHCNVNCTDLERSLAFYRDMLGLGTATHTNPDPQDGSGFGIDGPAAWDAWMMHDHRGPFSAPVVDLLEWLVPTPLGAPYTDPAAAGLAGLRFVVPSVSALADRLAPEQVVRVDEETAAIVDPDGVRLFITTGDVPSIEYRGVTVNCTDVAASSEWYRRVLGVESLEPAPGAGVAFGAPAGAVERLALPGWADRFTIQLEQAAGGTRGYSEANHVGVFRMAFIVADIDEGYERLRAHGVECFSPPVTLDMGPEVPIDGLRALFFPDPDGACLELIESVR